MNRALRAATMGALLLTPVVLTACSAGQVNQTASQDRDKVGPSVQVSDQLQLRQVSVVHPCEAGDEEATAYGPGDNPELMLSIVNSSREDDTLTGIEGELFDGVYVGEPPSETVTPTTPAAPTPATPTTGTPGTTDTPETTGAPGTTGAPTSAAQPTATDSPDITVPAQSTLTIGLRQYPVSEDGEVEACEPEIDPQAPRLFLADLDVDRDNPLTPSQTVTMTLTFANAGEVTVQALVSGPAAGLPRGEAYDFHEEEGAESGDEQDTEAE